MHRLYFTFLLSAFYVAVGVFSTHDEQLLKETEVIVFSIGGEQLLQETGARLPLLGFYLFIPWLVLLFHAHPLNQFFLLSCKLFEFNRALGSLPPEQEHTQRGLSFPLIFSYVIIGTHHSRPIRWMFRTAVIVTILVIPVALLLTIQWKFLPYHNTWITFDHQVVLSLDLLLLWFFWPRLSSRSGHWHLHRRWPMWGNLVLTFLLLLGIWNLLVPPGGGIVGIERWIGYQSWLDRIHRNLDLPERTLMRKDPPANLLFKARGDAEKEKWVREEAGEALDLSGRDLRYADLSKSKLWDADLRGAQLQHAILEETQLQGADMRPIDRAGVSRRTDLRHAQLQGANLKDTKLQEAQLQIADLRLARLQGANLFGAQLRGANLWRAQLQGADLREAAVYGTRFQDTELSLADLRGLHSLPIGWEGQRLG